MGCYKIIQQELYVPRMGRTGIRDRLQSDKIIRLRCHKFGPFHNRHTVYNTNQAPAYTKHKRGNSFFSTLLERQVSRNCNISCTLKKDNLLNLPGQICSRSQCRTVGPLAARECTSTFPVVGQYYVKKTVLLQKQAEIGDCTQNVKPRNFLVSIPEQNIYTVTNECFPYAVPASAVDIFHLRNNIFILRQSEAAQIATVQWLNLSQ